jgi:PAS domain S-box-containing protein
MGKADVVSHRQTEENQRFRLLIESVTDYAIYMLDPAGTVTSWNAGAERIKGYTGQEILGKSFARFYPEEDRATRLPQRVLREAETQGRFEGEGWRVRKDGTRFWAHVVIDPIRSSEGELLGFAKITRDLSAKQAAVTALNESEDRFRLLVQGVTDYAIYMLDIGGRVTSWNPGAERIKGYAAPEIIGKSFTRFYTDEDRAAGVPAHALETAAKEGRFETEAWRVRKNGARFWASVVIDAIRDPTGALVGYAKITRDLTERRNAQKDLSRSDQQFRRLVQGVQDYAIYMLDPDGRVANWNAGAERIKGYTADEIVGKHFSVFYIDEDVEAGAPRQALETALHEGKFETVTRRRRKDGTQFWAHVVIDPIFDDDGAHIGFAKITRDVTAQHDAEEALAQARAHLTQSQKMEAIGQLTGGVAHDFNNLLTAILGSLAIVRKRVPDDPRVTRFLDNAVHAAQRGAALTQRMLAFARRQDLEMTAIDIPALIHGLGQLFQASIGATIPIDIRLPSDLPYAKGDVNQLELALLNLVVNARDAMPDGGRITIGGRIEESVGAAAGLAPGRYVCLSVADTGSGMDEATLARSAEPFFTTKGVGRGTGLGLSMVHGVAEQSGGRLVLRSRVGEGTTAEIWLPVASEELAGKSAQHPDAPRPAEGSPITILVVDDDPLVLVNTAAMLDDLGHRVIEASSGHQALQLLRRTESIDLVIADQMMPNMTGIELIAAIRADRPDMPVVLSTGYGELPAGADPGLLKISKPYQQAALARVVARYGRSSA